MVENVATSTNALDWLATAKPTYVRLVDTLIVLLRLLLNSQGIAVVGVQGRVKADESFLAKIKSKNYSDPASQTTDIAGLRIITLVESDIRRAQAVIGESFVVHPDDSIDKSSSLGVDKVGYRSVHLICELGQDRIHLPEFREFDGLRFEVQIRTSLQHAWAEIEHDRGYKLKGELPSHLKRKFALLAGLLELADSQFDELTIAIDKYVAEIAQKPANEYAGVELNSSSLRVYLASKFGENLIDIKLAQDWAELLQEIREFGVADLHGFDALVTDDVREKLMRVNPRGYASGFLRGSLLFSDMEKYFSKSWKGSWKTVNQSLYDALAEHVGEEVVRAEFAKRGIDTYLDSED